MMLKYIKILVIIMALFFGIDVVNANIICNDGTTSPTCTTCSRGCCSRHGGCSGSSTNSSGSASRSRSSSSSSIVNSSRSVAVIKRDSNNKLKSLTINGAAITISNNMSYTTTDNKATILATAESGKASVNYNKSINLKHGDNKQTISVTAENWSRRIYYLTIKKVNNNNSLKSIKMNGENVSLEDMEYKTIKDSVSTEITPEDKYAKVEYEKTKKLEARTTELPIKCIAENGDPKDYNVTITKISTDNSIKKIFVNNKEVSLNDMKITSTSKNVDIQVIASNEYATAKYAKEKQLKVGDNNIIIEVTSESGDKKEYNLIIEYDDTMDKVATFIITTTAIGGSSAGTYYGIKQQKKKKANSIICSNCNKRNATDDILCIYCGKKL